MVSINGLSSVFPENKVFQEDVKDLGRKLFSSKIDFRKMEKVYDNSGVKTRYLSENLSWYLNEHNWSERNYLFKKNALFLLKKAIMETISKTNTIPEKIGGIVLVNRQVFQPQALMLKFLIYLILTMKLYDCPSLDTDVLVEFWD